MPADPAVPVTTPKEKGVLDAAWAYHRAFTAMTAAPSDHERRSAYHHAKNDLMAAAEGLEDADYGKQP